MLNSFYFIEQVDSTESEVHATVRIDPEHVILKAHFPEQAVVPGVCMMEMIKDILSTSQKKPMSMIQASVIKFLTLFTPQQTTEVRIHLLLKPKENILSCDATIRYGDTVFMKCKADYQ